MEEKFYNDFEVEYYIQGKKVNLVAHSYNINTIGINGELLYKNTNGDTLLSILDSKLQNTHNSVSFDLEIVLKEKEKSAWLKGIQIISECGGCTNDDIVNLIAYTYKAEEYIPFRERED